MITKTQNYKQVKNLLSKGSTNSKTAKNSIETYILYLAPHTQNSKKINICPKASKGCAAACLFSAGRGKFSNVIASLFLTGIPFFWCGTAFAICYPQLFLV